MRWSVPSKLLRTPPEGEGPTSVLEVDLAGGVSTVPLEGETPREEDVLVGLFDGVVWYARAAERPTAPVTDFRRTPTELVATASALVRWHAGAPRCEVCHGPTRSVVRGQRRQCDDCGALLFYRTDPAVIVAITDEADRLLLARQRTWAVGRVSVIAGFVEPGESLEQACAREALEEVNLALDSIRYFGSQPWPFPRSLMLGFTARVNDPGTLQVDGFEIVEADFLTKRELEERLGQGKVTLPGPASIGRALIDSWRH
ncbi:MAG: NAD(+) diphosphatase [Propionibacterium sp.]|nr:NAD(+) diphosphatase [Propionibacterium sp.]